MLDKIKHTPPKTIRIWARKYGQQKGERKSKNEAKMKLEGCITGAVMLSRSCWAWSWPEAPDVHTACQHTVSHSFSDPLITIMNFWGYRLTPNTLCIHTRPWRSDAGSALFNRYTGVTLPGIADPGLDWTSGITAVWMQRVKHNGFNEYIQPLWNSWVVILCCFSCQTW